MPPSASPPAAPTGDDAVLQVRSDGAVRVLTLNRPRALNSLDAALHEALHEALDAAAADADVRAVLLTGAGRAFCVGQDLSDPLVQPVAGEPPKDLSLALARWYTPLVQRLKNLPVPLVVAVNGVAAGAGANLALHGDVVLAGESAQFLQAFARIGLVPDSGGTWLLPRLVGRARALGLALLGDQITAAQAQQLGLIWQVCPDAELQGAALALAQRLAQGAVPAVVHTRRLMDAAMTQSLDEALAAESAAQQRLGWAADYQEGVQAFMDKRPPVFKDR